jgi:archaellin
MAIKINLKEINPSDSQEITIDKLNFNFNKLLELGIGDLGPVGPTGLPGSAGPVGITGDTGTRGNSWFVDSITDPNTLTINDLLTGDFYLDSNNLAIWQYNGTSWIFVADISGVVNTYLQNSNSPFIRGLGIGSPNDDRFITFTRRGNTALDISNDSTVGAYSPNNSNNDILFISNINEDTLNNLLSPTGFQYGPVYGGTPPYSTNDLYNSLLSIMVDHTTNSTGRYHMEFGELYDDGGDPRITTAFETFKLRYVRSLSSIQPGADHYNKMVFSLDIPELSPDSSRVANSAFEFVLPKVVPSTSFDQAKVYIGSQYALDEIVGSVGAVPSDGLLFTLKNPLFDYIANLGIAINYDINGGDFPTSTGYVNNDLTEKYLMLGGIQNIDKLFVTSEIYQDGGNIIQLGTTIPREVSNSTSGSGVIPSSFVGHAGITQLGEKLYTVNGDPDITDLNNYGYFNKFNIINPNNPTAEFYNPYIEFDGATVEGGSPIIACNELYNAGKSPIGPGASDIKTDGKYLYVVNSQNIINSTNITGVFFGDDYFRTYFQILETDSLNDLGLRRISRLGYQKMRGSSSLGNDPEELNSAYKIELTGEHAIIGRNALYSGATRAFLGGINTTSYPANSEYDGGIASINITDPTDPYIEASINVDTTTSSISGTLRSAIIDMKIIGNNVVTLTWIQNLAATCSYEIRMDVFDISDLDKNSPSISWKANTNTLSSGTVSNDSAYNLIKKRGAIDNNSKMVFSGYGDAISVMLFNQPTHSGTYPTCVIDYSIVSTTNLTFPVGYTSGEILDIKVLGNSLYVLASAINITPSYFIFKFDISGGFNNTSTYFDTPVQIYCKQLSDEASRFTVIGKHIYVVSNNSLTSVDFDGTYTGGAHIESLRADELNVMGKSKFGDSSYFERDLTVNKKLKIGEELSILGKVSGTTHINVSALSTQLLNDAVENIITLDDVKYDTLNEWNGSDTFTAKVDGYYLFSFTANIINYDGVLSSDWANGNYFDIGIEKNVSGYPFEKDNLIYVPQVGTGTSTQPTLVSISKTLYLDAGDEVNINIIPNVGSDTTIFNFFGQGAPDLTIDRLV